MNTRITKAVTHCQHKMPVWFQELTKYQYKNVTSHSTNSMSVSF